MIETSASLRPLPLRVKDFLLLDRSGAFANYAKTELIAGGLVCGKTQHRPHARVKGQLFLEINRVLGGTELAVLIEATIGMPPHDAPEPDLVITREPGGDGPVPLSSVCLVVEIADTTLAHDLGTKAALYARHGVAEYWVVDIEGREIHQHWAVADNGYREHRILKFGDPVDAATIAGMRIATDMLG